MKLRHTPVALALAAALLPGARAMDLLEAWRAAAQHAPEAATAAAARDAGAARAEQARALWRPTLQLEGGVSHASAETAVRGAQFTAPGLGTSNGVAFDTSVTGGTAARYALALRQPLVSRERSARREALEIAGRAAGVEWTQARQALMLQTTQAYLDAALAAEQLRLLERQQEAVARAATEAKDRFDIGDRPITDVHEATARAASLRAERLLAENRLVLARAVLADLTGSTDTDSPLALPGDVAPDDAGPLDGWLARAAQASPALLLARAQAETAQAQARASAAAFSPTVDAVAQFGRDRLSGSGDFGSASNTARNASIGVQLSLPLYTGGMRSAQAAETGALARQADAELERARQSVARQVRAAWLDLAAGHGRTLALAAALEASRARLDATRVGLQAGDRTTLDLLNAQNDAAAAELALAQARVQLLVQRLRLSSLAGELDETALARANATLTEGTK